MSPYEFMMQFFQDFVPCYHPKGIALESSLWPKLHRSPKQQSNVQHVNWLTLNFQVLTYIFAIHIYIQFYTYEGLVRKKCAMPSSAIPSLS